MVVTCEISVRDVYVYNDYVYRRDRDRSVLQFLFYYENIKVEERTRVTNGMFQACNLLVSCEVFQQFCNELLQVTHDIECNAEELIFYFCADCLPGCCVTCVHWIFLKWLLCLALMNMSCKSISCD